MENLIKKLQEEVGLTKDQVIKSISIIKDFMQKENISADWEKFFKGKYDEFADKAKDLFEDVSDKAEGFMSQAEKAIRDLSHKASDILNGDEDDDKVKK